MDLSFNFNCEFYACTPDHKVAIYVTANNACVGQHGSCLGVQIDSWISGELGIVGDRINERIQRNTSLREATPFNIKAATANAKALVISIERDYGLKFYTGERALQERFYTFDAYARPLWDKYVAQLEGAPTQILLDEWNKAWNEKPDSDFHKENCLKFAIVKQIRIDESREALRAIM